MFFDNIMDNYNNIIFAGSKLMMSDKRFFEQEITRWKNSARRLNQVIGEKYYRGEHDILTRQRMVIGKSGSLEPVKNLPNNRIVNNQYAKMVDQKTNYLFGKPFNIQTNNKSYEESLALIFDKRFHRTLQNLAEDSLNGGIGWIYVYYNDVGEFCFMRFAPYEILPFWNDNAHTSLNCVVRVYQEEVYQAEELVLIDKVEIYKQDIIERYILVDGALLEDIANPSTPYMTKNGKPYKWERVPIIGFKYNDEEIPLICKVKTLQDAINITMSDFQNNMQEDSRNTILIIKNYDGENLSEFRHNLAVYGAVKVRTIDGSAGDVSTLQVDVNAENYKSLLDIFKKALIENAMGYDSKDDRMQGNPNQMNIQSMYSDIDLDASGMEMEFQSGLEDLLYFVNAHLANTGHGDFQGEPLEIVFNRDVLMNEADRINNVKNSVGIISTETLISHHPWVTDIASEIEHVEEEAKKLQEYNGTLPPGDDSA